MKLRLTGAGGYTGRGLSEVLASQHFVRGADIVEKTTACQDWFYPGQPDICHPEVIAHVADQFRKRLEKDDQFHSFGIGANDTHLWPDSEYTRAVGNPGAQSLYFANGIADLLRPDGIRLRA